MAAFQKFEGKTKAVKKDTIFGAAKTFFGPSYFVTALGQKYVKFFVVVFFWKI